MVTCAAIMIELLLGFGATCIIAGVTLIILHLGE